MINYASSYIDRLAQIVYLLTHNLLLISILGFAVSNLQCSAKAPVLLMHQHKSLVLNQSYLPTLYTVTASFNDQGPLRIVIPCQSITNQSITSQSITSQKAKEAKEAKDAKKSMADKAPPKYTNDLHSTLHTHHWYTLAQLQKDQGINIKRSIVRSLALPIKSDLQGIQWAYIKKVQIDGLIFKDMMWQVKASDELPTTIDAQISCRTLIKSMGSSKIVVRHQVEQGKLLFWHTSPERLNHTTDFIQASSDTSHSLPSHNDSKPMNTSSISSIKIKKDRPKEDRPKEDRPKEDRPKKDKSIKTKQLNPKTVSSHLYSSQNFRTRMQSNEHLERFNPIWSFKRSYSSTHIAVVAQYQHASILGTRHGKIALDLIPHHLGQRISKKENNLRIQWRTPRNKLPKDLWFLVNLSNSIDQPFYVRVHINIDQPSHSWISSTWPKSQIIDPINPGAHIKVLDILRGPWKCTHAVCLAEVPLATIRAIKESL